MSTKIKKKVKLIIPQANQDPDSSTHIISQLLEPK